MQHYQTSKKKSDPDTRFKAKYPEGKLMNIADADLTFDDVRKGIYLNVNSETKPSEKLDRSKIISLGIGSKTQFL